MILNIVTALMLLEVSYRAPATTTDINLLVECSNGFFSSSTFPSRSGTGYREIKGDMDGTCILYMEAYNKPPGKDEKVVDREQRKFFAMGPLSRGRN